MKDKLISRPVAIVLLVISTLLDCGTTYASIGHKLSLDGNLLIRGFNWTQLLTLQASAGIVIALAFWFASRKQQRIWPNAEMGFWAFLKYRLKKGSKLGFSSEHVRTEAIYAGVLLLWVATLTHFLAGIIAGSPLLGGPSFLDVLRPLGIHELRMCQNITTLFILLVAILAAHYPLYVNYTMNPKRTRITTEST